MKDSTVINKLYSECSHQKKNSDSNSNESKTNNKQATCDFSCS